ncbi:MAG: hypothetical protein R3C40_07635 [Parvularculaceae bacterium]
MSKDVRKEQVKLLQFEKRLVGLAAFLAAGASTAASASTKINHDAASRAYDDIRVAFAHLADVTSQAHAALEASVANEGLRALEASGGVPKRDVAQVVQSVLGLG